MYVLHIYTYVYNTRKKKIFEWLLAISWREQVTLDGMMMMNVRFVNNFYYEIKSVVKAA
jgi:hypothetical protein